MPLTLETFEFYNLPEDDPFILVETKEQAARRIKRDIMRLFEITIESRDTIKQFKENENDRIWTRVRPTTVADVKYRYDTLNTQKFRIYLGSTLIHTISFHRNFKIADSISIYNAWSDSNVQRRQKREEVGKWLYENGFSRITYAYSSFTMPVLDLRLKPGCIDATRH